MSPPHTVVDLPRFFHFTPLRPLRLRPLTQHPPPLLRINNPIIHHSPNLKVLLMIPKEPLPPRNSLLNLLPSQPNLSFTTDLPLRRRKTLILHVLHRQKHLFNTNQIRRQVILETARHEGTSRVSPCEKVVAPAWAVDCWVGGDVEDGPVDGEVDREGGVCAVVEG